MENQIVSRILHCFSVFDFLSAEISRKNLKQEIQGVSIHYLLDKIIQEEHKDNKQWIKVTHPVSDDAKEKIRRNLPRLGFASQNVGRMADRAAESGVYLVNHAQAKRFPKYIPPENATTNLFAVWLNEGETVEDPVRRCWNEKEKAVTDNGGSIPEPSADTNVKPHGVASVTVESSQAVSVTVSFN